VKRPRLLCLLIGQPLDLNQLLAISKGERQGQFLTADDVRDSSAGGAAVTLGELHGVQHVNALAVGERLSFGKSGVTVIYGDNGARKSGYARILKSLCRARSPKGDTILPNIYAPAPGVPTASVDFHVGGQKHSARWRQGQAADPTMVQNCRCNKESRPIAWNRASCRGGFSRTVQGQRPAPRLET
jgi:hypothetical protein